MRFSMPIVLKRERGWQRAKGFFGPLRLPMQLEPVKKFFERLVLVFGFYAHDRVGNAPTIPDHGAGVKHLPKLFQRVHQATDLHSLGKSSHGRLNSPDGPDPSWVKRPTARFTRADGHMVNQSRDHRPSPVEPGCLPRLVNRVRTGNDVS